MPAARRRRLSGLYSSLADGAYRSAFARTSLRSPTAKRRHAFHATVTVTEITGSESFVI